MLRNQSKACLSRFGLAPCGGKPAVTDGPYAEAKEIVGGFFIIEAVRVASLHPAATLGESVGWGIEVHPIVFLSKQQKLRLMRSSAIQMVLHIASGLALQCDKGRRIHALLWGSVRTGEVAPDGPQCRSTD